MNADELELGQKVALGGAGAVGIGGFLPWPAGTGIDGVGLFTLVFVLLAVALVATGVWRDVHRAVLGLGVLTTVVALTALPNASAIADPGAGLYLAVVGGIAVAAGGGLGYVGSGPSEQAVDLAD